MTDLAKALAAARASNARYQENATNENARVAADDAHDLLAVLDAQAPPAAVPRGRGDTSLSTVPLSKRVRPGIEAAPWVIEAIVKLETILAEQAPPAANSSKVADYQRLGLALMRTQKSGDCLEEENVLVQLKEVWAAMTPDERKNSVAISKELGKLLASAERQAARLRRAQGEQQ